MSNRNLHYWQYFVALESDLAKATRYVEIAESNMATYSVEFARLILSAGSEIDVLAKVLCDQHQLPVSPQNIDGYRKAITGRFAEFVWLQIRVPRYALQVLPWRTWHDGKNPEWWRAYNDIKHERHINFAHATLKNALHSMAGLFSLVCYVCHQELRANEAAPWPELLSLDPSLNSRIRNDRRPAYVLPDFGQ